MHLLLDFHKSFHLHLQIFLRFCLPHCIALYILCKVFLASFLIFRSFLFSMIQHSTTLYFFRFLVYLIIHELFRSEFFLILPFFLHNTFCSYGYCAQCCKPIHHFADKDLSNFFSLQFCDVVVDAAICIFI